MKKILSTLLAIVMLSLSACGATQVSPNSKQTESAVTGETIVLKIANSYNVNEMGGKAIAYFADYIEEHTGGSVKFERYMGGTLCALPEEFAFCSSGAIDVCTILQDMFISAVPYINIPGQIVGSPQDGVDFYNAILFDNTEVRAMVDEQAAKSNVIIIGSQPVGSMTYCCAKPIASLDELAKYKLGANRTQNIFEAAGLAVINVSVSDTYDSLSRGVCDASVLGLAPMMDLKWYEVAPNLLVSNLNSNSNFFTVNLDTWNKLSAEQQQVFYDAVDATSEYCVGLLDKAYASAKEVVEAAGGTFVIMPEEDDVKFNEAQFPIMAQMALEAAENLDAGDGMRLINQNCADYLGVDYAG